MSDDLDSSNFNMNYKVLKVTADWLTGQKEPKPSADGDGDDITF